MSGPGFFEQQARVLLAAASGARTQRDAQAYRELARHFEAQVLKSAGRAD